MNTHHVIAIKRAYYFSEWQCYAFYLIIISPLICAIILFKSGNRFIFHSLLFFTGWLTATFLEYIAHRFWMHGKENKKPGKSLKQHMHHHSHPTELKITDGMRNKLLISNFLLIIVAVLLDNYFTLFAGFFTGFVYYCFMHVFLHKRWVKKVFPGLQVSHIHHHCKYPGRCFGTCVTWWDRAFNTAVSRKTRIPEKVIEFYFGEKHE